MSYRIARHGQVFGPYSAAEVQQYLASGNIVPDDLAQAEGSADWISVAQMFAAAGSTGTAAPGGASVYAGVAPAGFAADRPSPNLYPDPPDLPWWVALLLDVFTAGIFFVVWDTVQAAWMRRVQPRASSLLLFAVADVLFLINLSSSLHSVAYWVFHIPFTAAPHAGLLGLARVILWLIARFVLRGELLQHFNTVEPLGLRLNAFWTLLFGGLYFQYHFNKINRIKRTLRTGVPSF